MTSDIEWPLGRSQSLDNAQAGFIDSAFWLFSVFKGDANLVTQLGTLVLLEVGVRLVEIIFHEVQKIRIVVLGYARVFEDECTEDDQRVCSLYAPIRARLGSLDVTDLFALIDDYLRVLRVGPKDIEVDERKFRRDISAVVHGVCQQSLN